jgi:hypothetical protein
MSIVKYCNVQHTTYCNTYCVVLYTPLYVLYTLLSYNQTHLQPRTQDLSLGKTLAAAGHVPHQKFSAGGGVGKVSNYINRLPVEYSLKT